MYFSFVIFLGGTGGTEGRVLIGTVRDWFSQYHVQNNVSKVSTHCAEKLSLSLFFINYLFFSIWKEPK